MYFERNTIHLDGFIIEHRDDGIHLVLIDKDRESFNDVNLSQNDIAEELITSLMDLL